MIFVWYLPHPVLYSLNKIKLASQRRMGYLVIGSNIYKSSLARLDCQDYPNHSNIQPLNYIPSINYQVLMLRDGNTMDR